MTFSLPSSSSLLKLPSEDDGYGEGCACSDGACGDDDHHDEDGDGQGLTETVMVVVVVVVVVMVVGADGQGGGGYATYFWHCKHYCLFILIITEKSQSQGTETRLRWRKDQTQWRQATEQQDR